MPLYVVVGQKWRKKRQINRYFYFQSVQAQTIRKLSEKSKKMCVARHDSVIKLLKYLVTYVFLAFKTLSSFFFVAVRLHKKIALSTHHTGGIVFDI